MKILSTTRVLFGLLLTASCAFGVFQERTITQLLRPIDQFDTRTWENHYFIDDSYYQVGGPLFVVTGSSLNLDYNAWMYNTYFFDLGRELGALLLFTEHRFYENNRPTENTSFANLQFLDTRYAIDDVANLVAHIKEVYSAGAVIAHGMDHSGAISVWLAHRYPNLVDGVWASSASLVAQKDYSVYLTHVAEDIRVIGGAECYHQTELAFERMEYLYSRGDFAPIEAAFNLCSPFTPGDPIEGAVFFAAYAMGIGATIRYTHRVGVESLCRYYENHEDPMVALGSFANSTNIYNCVPLDAYSQLTIFQNVTWESTAHDYGMRQLTYQNCRELGWYVSSSGADHPFGKRFPIELFQQQCYYLFGPIFTTPNMNSFYDETNRIFGGNRPNITNAYFTVGEFDPAQDLGVLEEYHDTIHVDIIPDFGAGAEVAAEGVFPQEQIAAVHERVRNLINEWIAQAK